MSLITRRSLLRTAGAIAALPLLGSRAFAQDPLKVAWVYPGPIGDFGWAYAHEQGRQAAIAEFGDAIETTFVENVAEGPDSERVIRNLANNGNQLIFGASFGFRTLVDPADPGDVDTVHALRDAIKVEQPGGPGTFETPAWDSASQKKVRDALVVLASTLTDTSRSFGMPGEVDPVQRLISAAATWGGNPRKDAIYLNFTPPMDDGATLYRLHVADVPVDGFWSVSLYNADGYYEKNDLGAYSLNNITSKKNPDGSVDIQFGGCDGKVANCLPTMPGWNYTVRLYRPRAEVLDGSWTFPESKPAE